MSVANSEATAAGFVQPSSTNLDESACNVDATSAGFRQNTCKSNSVTECNGNRSADTDPGSVSSDAVKDDPLIGSTIGRFQIESVIASGGMGSVYKALQSEPVRRYVALKMIKSGLEDQATISRFYAERQALALMDHPDIARVYEADATPSGTPYFAMEYCEGLPIDQYCAERCLGVNQRVELVIRIARAVQRAHANGIVHRDLKPGNVMVSDCEGRPNLKVIDFGIAKFTDETYATSNNATRIGEMVGTPAYMSPEQAAGATIDARTDVFAIGAILFKLLTGSTPLTAPPDDAQSLADIILHVQSFEPVTPTRRIADADDDFKAVFAETLGFAKPNQWAAAVKGDLDWIALRAIEPDKLRRYATADDLADDLQRFLNREPVVAVAPTFSYRSRKYYQRHRVPVIAAAAIASTILIASGIGGYSWQQYERERRIEVAEVTSEVEQLLGDANAARSRAAEGGEHSDAEFRTAQANIAKVESLLASRPSLSGLQVRYLAARLQIRSDESALTLIRLLDDARERATHLTPSDIGDTFGRSIAVDSILQAYRDFGIIPAETPASDAAAKLDACPRTTLGSLIESLDCLLSEGSAADWAHDVLAIMDPDPWRSELRGAILSADLHVLRTLAESKHVDTQPPSSLIQLAASLHQLEPSNDAIRLLKMAQKNHPANYWANHFLGTALCVAHQPPRPEEGLRFLTAAVSLRPNSVGARINLAESLERVGDRESALPHVKIAAELMPGYRPLLQRLAALSSDISEVKQPVATDTTTQLGAVEPAADSPIRRIDN
ncbi:protein kinase domain-containing protein [Novipirellula sp. SH528]|uniref:protein kinase domain-containing protein n=1 Tax=Novipirellula sp. SH528 TaxID=3454466 RepID=UPI003F9F42D3